MELLCGFVIWISVADFPLVEAVFISPQTYQHMMMTFAHLKDEKMSSWYSLNWHFSYYALLLFLYVLKPFVFSFLFLLGYCDLLLLR